VYQFTLSALLVHCKALEPCFSLSEVDTWIKALTVLSDWVTFLKGACRTTEHRKKSGGEEVTMHVGISFGNPDSLPAGRLQLLVQKNPETQ
jgi:hypothetical protein